MENTVAAAPSPAIETPNTPPPALAEGQISQEAEPVVEEQLSSAQIKELRELAELGKGARELKRGAYQAMEAAAKERQELAKQKESLKKDFISGLMEDKDLNLTKDQIRSRFESWYKQEFIEPEMMTEEQREMADLRRYKAQAEDRMRLELEAKTQKEDEDRLNSTREELQNEMIELIEKAGLPKTRFTLARMAFYKKQNLSRGYDAPADMIVQQVKDERADLIKTDLSSRTAEQIVEDLGEEIIQKLRKYDLERLKNKFGAQAIDKSVIPPRDDRGKFKSMKDVDQYLNRMRFEKA